ncbi:GNAT family N-acetyltransferase [Oceanimonas sp. MB9]|uniref:GNAT family N-acetyltransferase n=1 Tax=Oceanimonas sp. MB9 TaxID=2588453 RepID=UPI0013F62522|nr:GNAT family N-acetyltransferase [Oceanimonas sp. MB9]NHI00430.1 hypothetical protein [Oceanimonas sp. MB9]
MIAGNVQLPHGITARPARPADKAFLTTLHKDSRPELTQLNAEQDFIEMTLELQLKAQTQGYGGQFPNAIYLILEKNGSRIGKLTLDIGPVELRIIDLAFIPKARDKGFGPAIILWVMKAAAQTRKPLVAPTRRDLTGLMTFLRRYGFVEEEQLSDSVYARMIWFPNQAEMHGGADIRPRTAGGGTL